MSRHTLTHSELPLTLCLGSCYPIHLTFAQLAPLLGRPVSEELLTPQSDEQPFLGIHVPHSRMSSWPLSMFESFTRGELQRKKIGSH